MRDVRLAAAAVLVLAAAGCATGGSPDAESSPRAGTTAGAGTAAPSTTVTPAPTHPPSVVRTGGPATPRRHPGAPKLGTWTVGAHPLPLRPDGFGRVLPTPPRLRVRRLATVDVLPPPPHGRFRSSIGPVTPALRARMGASWSPRCPVGLRGLRYVTVSFRGFDGRPHTGELVVNARVASDVVRVFRRLYAARFPIESMRLPTTADVKAPPTGDGNDTAAMVCRATRTTTTWSAHAYGLAIDVNPFMNPYHKGDLVLPELASAYLNRSWHRPGMILRGGVVTRAFASVGWAWGGDYSLLKDRMHFSANGR